MGGTAAVVLAAGLSSRYRAAAGPAGPSTKLVSAHEGKPLVRRVAEAALASSARPVIVVTGHAHSDVESALAGLDASFVYNAHFASGLASSLRAGIAALPASADAAIILLGDMPRISGKVLDKLIAAYGVHPSASAVIPLFRGKRGNPVLLARSLFAFVEKLEGDSGARALLAHAGDGVAEVEMDDPAILFDIDTPTP